MSKKHPAWYDMADQEYTILYTIYTIYKYMNTIEVLP